MRSPAPRPLPGGRLRALAVLLLVLAAALLPGCRDGGADEVLTCGSDFSCADGFSCVDGACEADDAGPTDGAVSGDDAPAGDDVPPADGAGACEEACPDEG